MSEPACRTEPTRSSRERCSGAGISRYAYRGRHRKPPTGTTAVRTAALSAGVVAAVMVGSAGTASAAPTADPWAKLRGCESGGNYKINTGNGYYGAYQFDVGTWRAYGGSGYPHQAAPAEQDYRAKLLFRARGWAPWPACAAKLGLRNDPAYGRTGPAPVSAPVAAPVRAWTSGAFVVGRPLYVRGSAAPHAVVDVFSAQYGSRAFVRSARVRANAKGLWTARFRPSRDVTFYAVSGRRHSTVVRSKARFLTTLASPPVAVVNTAYRLGGRARPNATVLVLSKPYHSTKWTGARKIRADARGRWSLPWRATTDWKFQAYGETRTAVAGSKVATTVSPPTATVRTAAAAASTLRGTARPGSRVTVYTMRYGSRTWVVLAPVGVTSGGRWSTTVPAGSRMAFVARSSSGQSSPVTRIA